MGVEIEMKDNTVKILTAFERAVSRGLETIGMTAEGYAKDTLIDAKFQHPTGRLWNSINWATKERSGNDGDKPNGTPEDGTVYIGTNVEYAIWHEIGTGIYAEDGQGRKSPWAFQDEKGEWHMTRGVKPLHFLQDAACNHSDEYRRIMEASMKGENV